LPDPLIAPSRINSIVREDGTMHELFLSWVEDITRTVNNSAVLSGPGSPETVVEASVGRFYVDTGAPLLYYKATGDGDTGWVAL